MSRYNRKKRIVSRAWYLFEVTFGQPEHQKNPAHFYALKFHWLKPIPISQISFQNIHKSVAQLRWTNW